MSKGIALNIGLNRVDPKHYGGWEGPLNACEADAKEMAGLATQAGFEAKTLLTEKATSKALMSEISRAADALSSGGLFLLTYSGHGGQIRDKNADELDGLDETWCLFDREFIDDEIYNALTQFAEKVRVLILSDSCHSGTVGRLVAETAPATESTNWRPKVMPPQVAFRTYDANRDMYDALQANPELRDAERRLRAPVLLIAGCQDHQLSWEGAFGGEFTGSLVRTWNRGRFRGDYRRFHNAIVAAMPVTPQPQTPNLYWVSPRHREYESQRPFSI